MRSDHAHYPFLRYRNNGRFQRLHCRAYQFRPSRHSRCPRPVRVSRRYCFVPISKSTLWRHLWHLPAEPVKLSERVTVWRAEDIRRWMVQQAPTRVRASKRRIGSARNVVGIPVIDWAGTDPP